ncbi:hypothetical protein CHS0354_005908 [Potamilus streckersoni]|uniref:Uncharacterized protein n=1 Tax=Potamilus streckersoni TaxID=2493646 RepID=A0AAE0W634_9BIVA|nr:hypothetical protein CHS0354_005908 [Potamilus streckersoni]
MQGKFRFAPSLFVVTVVDMQYCRKLRISGDIVREQSDIGTLRRKRDHRSKLHYAHRPSWSLYQHQYEARGALYELRVNNVGDKNKPAMLRNRRLRQTGEQLDMNSEHVFDR